MKRKRGGEEDEGWICDLGLQWTSRRRAPDEDKRGLSELGYKYMSSRPSLKPYGCGYYAGSPNGHEAHAHGHRSRWVARSDPGRHRRSQHPFFGDEDEFEDWISQLGARYMARKKLYEEHGRASDYGAFYPERNYVAARDNELDDSWIADFGLQWMRRRCRMRGVQHLSAGRKVGDDAWICELGYRWMSRTREREASNQAWLSDLGSNYMNRRNRHDNEWIHELGSSYMSRRRSFVEDRCVAKLGSQQWETRRKLDYRELGFELHGGGAGNGHGCEVDKGAAVAAEPEDEDKVNGSDSFQLLESNPLEDLEPASYIDLESSSSSS